MKPIRLRCEYLYCPLGIDVKIPRFSWNCELETPIILADHEMIQDHPEAQQSAYQIQAFRDDSLIWDSGKVLSAKMVNIPYAGEALRSRDQVAWRLRLWDGNDIPGETAESFFEMGLMENEDWQAKWISGNYEPEHDVRYPADCFRKTFRIPGAVQKARLYASACGLYEIRINGQKAGDACLMPGCTDYRTSIQYQTYDVTDLLRENEENALTAELGDGWYRGSVNAFGCTEVYGNQTKLLCQLEITLKDGSRLMIGSDAGFAWSNDGPIRLNDLKDGEVIDLRCEPGYTGFAREVEEKIVPTASNNVLPRMKERFSPKLIHTPKGHTLLDFGQNLAGFIAVSLRGQAGQQMKLTLGELLDEDGELTLANIQCRKTAMDFGPENQFKAMTGQLSPEDANVIPTPRQEVCLTLREGMNDYCTKFAIFGFRYAEVESDLPVSADMFEAIAVYSDMEMVGHFACDNMDVNRLWLNTLWSMRSNYLDIPTDCPTRERLGWTGDAQVFFRTGAYYYDTASFFAKWLKDMREAQDEKNVVPSVVPWAGMDMLYYGTGASAGFHDAAILIPWRYARINHDIRQLKQCYPMMKRAAQFMLDHMGPETEEDAPENPWRKYLYVKGVQLGEWSEPEEYKDPISAAGLPRQPEVATAYMFYSMKWMARTAELLGETEDRDHYRQISEGARKCYLYEYLRYGAPDTDRQAKLVRPLALGIVEEMPAEAQGIAPKDIREQLRKRLALAVEHRGYHVGTGFLSTAFLLPELTKMGRTDLAYRVLLNEENPGWIGQIRSGATTIWENWNGEASRNHYSPGTVCKWLMESVGGIELTDAAEIRIAPVTGGMIDRVEAEYLSPYGRFKVLREGDELQISQPANTAVQLSWPGKTKITLV